MSNNLELSSVSSVTVENSSQKKKGRVIIWSVVGLILVGASLIIPAAVVLTKDDEEIMTTIGSTDLASLSTIQTTSIPASPVLTTSTAVSTSETRSDVPQNMTCINQQWNFPSNLLSQWLFDGDLSDRTNHSNARSINTISFVSNGYVNQAVRFALNEDAMLLAPCIPLSYTSFTIDCWMFLTGLEDIYDHGIFSFCPEVVSFKCLHLTIRRNGRLYHLYLGFFNNDCEGVTPLKLNQWIHAAFVFDLSEMKQLIYLNGILENSCVVSSALTAEASEITIGYIPILNTNNGMTYFQGYLDQMTISNRAKSSSEILQIATLVAYFTFDDGLFLTDSSSNSLRARTEATFLISTGRYSQAIAFNHSSSFFQIKGLTSLGISNKEFSISLWIRPLLRQGILIYVSSNETGSGWCLPFLGFHSNGSLVAQISNSNGIFSLFSENSSLDLSLWSHLVQTWSISNGLRLYINNVLIQFSSNLPDTYLASGVSNYLTLANGLNDGKLCQIGQINPNGSFFGDIDDLQIYSRELSPDDVDRLYNK